MTWPNSQHNGQHVDALAEVKSDVKELVEGVKSLATIGETVQKFYDAYQKTSGGETSEDITVKTGEEQTFSTNGYRYNRLIVGDAAVSDTAKVIIRVGGISWTQTLTAGENVLNMPNGATYLASTTSGKNFIAVLIRSNRT